MRFAVALTRIFCRIFGVVAQLGGSFRQRGQRNRGRQLAPALIVRELEEEFHQRAQMAHEMDELTELKKKLSAAGHQMDQLYDVLNLYNRSIESGSELVPDVLATIEARFEEAKQKHHDLLGRFSRLSEHVSTQFNPCWGSFFKQGGSKTLFAQQVESFSCLYTSRVSNLGLYGTNHYFRVLEDPMMHELDAP